MLNLYFISLYNSQNQLISKQQEDIHKLLSQKKSSEVRLGQIGEHFAPLLEGFPYNSKNARFLGSPIDFVVFELEQDKIVFIEFKTGNSRETAKQRHIRDIVKRGNVEYRVMRVNESIEIK